MTVLKIRKITSLPETLEASCLYLLSGENNKVSIYITNSDGSVLYHSFDTSEGAAITQAIINTLLNNPGGIAGLDLDGLISEGVIPGYTDLKADVIAIRQRGREVVPGNGFLNQTDTIIGFTDNTRTFTISPSGTEYHFYVGDNVFNVTATRSVIIPNLSGLWFFYFDINGQLEASQSAWNMYVTAPICCGYWNTSLNKMQMLAEERHTCLMDISTHWYLHFVFGTKYRSGLLANNYVLNGLGNSNSHAQLAITGGIIYDEDLMIDIKHSNSPSANFEQVLSPIGYFPIAYRLGTDWVIDAPTAFPIKNGIARALYNRNNNGTYQLSEVSELHHFAMFIVATNSFTNPIVAVMGERQDLLLDDAKANNDYVTLNYGGVLFPEYKPLYQLIFQTSALFSNSVLSRLVDIQDLRSTETVSISANNNLSHGELLGLTADDHLQYVHIANPRAISAQHIFNPGVVSPPFTLGANAAGQFIAGLNAEYLGGHHYSELLATARNEYTGNVVTSSGNSVIPVSNSPPSIFDGSQIWNKTVTPVDVDSVFTIEMGAFVDSSSTGRNITIAIFRGNLYIGSITQGILSGSSYNSENVSLLIHDSPNTTDPVTYSCRIGVDVYGVTWYLNRASNFTFGGANKSGWRITES